MIILMVKQMSKRWTIVDCDDGSTLGIELNFFNRCKKVWVFIKSSPGGVTESMIRKEFKVDRGVVNRVIRTLALVNRHSLGSRYVKLDSSRYGNSNFYFYKGGEKK